MEFNRNVLEQEVQAPLFTALPGQPQDTTTPLQQHRPQQNECWIVSTV